MIVERVVAGSRIKRRIGGELVEVRLLRLARGRCARQLERLIFFRLTSAGLAIFPAITFALLAQLILLEARRPQFLANLLGRLLLASRLLARLAISPAITLPLLAQPVSVLAGQPQLLTLAASSSGGCAGRAR